MQPPDATTHQSSIVSLLPTKATFGWKLWYKPLMGADGENMQEQVFYRVKK